MTEYLPSSKIIFHITFENDNNIIWKKVGIAANAKYVITNFDLIIPKMSPNSKDKDLYLSEMKTHDWMFLKENMYIQGG